ncbi:hypothetical protein VTL71DRAFT_4030, partial [Oculimacula yallundae]
MVFEVHTSGMDWSIARPRSRACRDTEWYHWYGVPGGLFHHLTTKPDADVPESQPITNPADAGTDPLLTGGLAILDFQSNVMNSNRARAFIRSGGVYQERQLQK